jgi:large subunit ribosomal protein L31e
LAEEEERVFTVPLGMVWSVPRTKRVPRAVRFIKEYVQRHMKAKADNVWIDPRLNEVLWSRGREKPPRRLQVRVIKFEDELVEVSPLEPEKEIEEEREEAGAEEEGEEKPAEVEGEAVPEEAEGEKEEEVVEEPIPKPRAKPTPKAKGKGKAKKPKAKTSGGAKAPRKTKKGKKGGGKRSGRK